MNSFAPRSTSAGKPVDDPIRRFLETVALPPVVRVRQLFDDSQLEDPAGQLLDQLTGKLPEDLTGQRVAITCGSRGIDSYALLVRTLVSFLKERGAEPFLIPAMGSHGGATARGQQALLARLGITEETTGAPVVSSMQTRQIGLTAAGLPVYADARALEADGIVLLNRIKPHTSFRGPYESGLVKMLAVGLGKHDGAVQTHALRYENMAENLVAMGRVALDRLPILAGVATIENAAGRVASLHVLKGHEILAREPELLALAWSRMARLYIQTMDVLIVNEIGKEYSGTGMDTNTVGRFHTQAAGGGPQTIKLGVLKLSEQSGGNANGMGLADFVTRKLADQVDETATYLNTLTSTEPSSARLPLVLADDRLVFQACVKLCGQQTLDKVRLVVIQNTRALDDVLMSPAALQAVDQPDRIQVLSQPFALPFDAAGGFQAWA